MEVALWIDTPALGDTIAAIPALRKLSQAYGNQPVTVFTTKPFLFEGHPLVKEALKSDADKSNYKVYRTFSPLVGKGYDLMGDRVEFRYSNMDLRQFHAVSLGFTLTEAEMDMDLYIERERELPVKDYVIIHPTHTWPTRTWEQEKWQELVDRLNERGIPVVAVGRDAKEVGFFNTDKPVMPINIKLGVNLLNDPDNDPAELRWMMNHRARAVVTMDSGMLHIAGTTDVDIIQLGSSIDNKLRAPYRKGSQDWKYTYVRGGCGVFCSSNMKSNVEIHGSIQGVPPQVKCLENRPTFECHPSVDQVYDAVIGLYDVQPKIKLVHMLLEDDKTPERQEKSIQSLQALANRGIEYVQIWNKRWTGDVPRDTFADPANFDSIPIGPGHYGNFRAFADAAIDHYTEDLDAMIFCEGDALLVKPIQEVVDSINKAYKATQEKNIAYFSFGDRYHLENGSLQSNTWSQDGDIHIVDRVIGAQMVMVPAKFRSFLIDRFKHHVWTTADIFLNNIFTYKFNIGIFDKPVAIQVDGVSAIDSIQKSHIDGRAKLGTKVPKAYVAHCNEVYAPIVEKMLSTVREFSDIPAFVYVVNSDYKINVPGVETIRINSEMRTDQPLFTGPGGEDNIWVERKATSVYDIITKKVDACLHALENYADTIVYLDGDSVATPRVENLFGFYEDLPYPKFTTSVDEFMMVDGKGSPFTDNGLDLTLTVEYPACQLFGVDVNNRNYSENYVQTCYFVAGQSSIPFFKEWKDMCYDPRIVADHNAYTPFHEETLANILMWKYDYRKKMPLVYVNATSVETVHTTLYDIDYTNEDGHQKYDDWFVVPRNFENITMYHGEKRASMVDKMVDAIKVHNAISKKDKKRLVYLAPHLSTGGMPEFLLARVKAMLDDSTFEIHVVEYCLYATTYVVQRDQIKNLLGDRFHEIGHLGDMDQETREKQLQRYLRALQPDIIHIEESPESFDSFNQMSYDTQVWLYATHRPWKIVETCHNIWFDPRGGKRISPDAYALVSPHHRIETFSQEDSLKQEIHFPIIEQSVSEEDRRKLKEFLGFNPDADQYHLINIGLWTPGKNQGEAIEWARNLETAQPGRFQFHFIGNQASNFAHYWEPLMKDLPANCHVWGERSDVETFYGIADAVVFNSTWECNPLTIRQSLGWPLPVVARNLPQYHDLYTGLLTEITGDVPQDLLQLQRVLETKRPEPVKDSMKRFKQEHLELYINTLQTPTKRKNHMADWTLQWDGGPKVTSNVGREIHVDFHCDGKSVYNVTLQGEGHWARPATEYWKDWTVFIDGESHRLENSVQIVQFDSSSLGDTLSWVEPCVEFKNARGLEKVYLATHKNWLFDVKHYEALGVHFIAPGEWPEDAEARWKVGVYMEDPGGKVWFPNRNPRDWRKIYLGDIASDILGIETVERAPKLTYKGKTAQQRPYICIATASTAQAKYWNNPTGWQDLVDHYRGKGYDIYHISKESTELRGVKKAPEDLKDVYRLLQGAELFFGISSGLSWFAWCTNVPIVLISGFTPEECEFNSERTIRIINKSVCNGCWAREHFNRGDWNWCPDHKGTDRMFECTKTISAADVIEQVNTTLEKWNQEVSKSTVTA